VRAATARSTAAGKGYWCRPCFFTGVKPSHTIAREEIFGPVLAVMTFRTPEEAIGRANNTPYGLAAGVWTDKGSKIFHLASKLKAGVVWVNTYNRSMPRQPVRRLQGVGLRARGRRARAAETDDDTGLRR
jgi:aldehyde dehydrogenase (NAD+)